MLKPSNDNEWVNFKASLWLWKIKSFYEQKSENIIRNHQAFKPMTYDPLFSLQSILAEDYV